MIRIINLFIIKQCFILFKDFFFSERSLKYHYNHFKLFQVKVKNNLKSNQIQNFIPFRL